MKQVLADFITKRLNISLGEIRLILQAHDKALHGLDKLTNEVATAQREQVQRLTAIVDAQALEIERLVGLYESSTLRVSALEQEAARFASAGGEVEGRL